jgi:hypothetical protein
MKLCCLRLKFRKKTIVSAVGFELYKGTALLITRRTQMPPVTLQLLTLALARSARVTMPTGFVKSTIHASFARSRTR